MLIVAFIGSTLSWFRFWTQFVWHGIIFCTQLWLLVFVLTPQ